MNKIKVVVFDFDDTLYSGLEWTPWKNFCIKYVSVILKKFGVDCNMDQFIYSDTNIVNLLYKYNIPASEWINLKKEKLNELKSGYDYSNIDIVKDKVLKEFEQNVILFIASNSTINEIEDTATRLNIHLNHFKKVYTNNFEKSDTSKKPILKQIMKEENIKPEEMLMVGDSYKTDIIPSKELKINWYQVEDATFTFEQVMTNYTK